jgi:hypothetical protein
VCHLIGSSEADDSEKVSHFILATCGPGFHVAQVVLQTWGFSGKGPNTLIPTNRDELHNGKPPIGTCPRIGRRDWRSRVAPRVILSGVEARRTGRNLLRPSQRVFIQLSKSSMLPASESGRELSRRGGRASSLIGWQIFERVSTGLSASAAVTCTFLMAHRYDAEGSLNVSRVPTQTLRLLQSSLRDYRLLPPCSRHCAALRARLITIAAPRLNIAVEPSGRPQSCHTDFEAPSPLKCLLFPQATKSDRAQMCRTYGAWNGGGLVSQRSRVGLMSAAPTALGRSRFRQWSDR